MQIFKFRPNPRIAMICLLALFLTVITVSAVFAFSSSSDYFEVTCYWEVTCIPQSFHSHNNGSGASTRISSTTWRVDNQSFGGYVYPQYSICGGSAWVMNSTYYVDKYGNHTIVGWWDTGSWCNTNYSCANFYSSQVQYLYPDPLHGNFYSATAYGDDCLPSGSVSQHLLTVYP